MVEISFYHLTSTSLEKALPKLLEKIILLKKNVVVFARDEEQVELLNETLWTYSTRTFLPHGSGRDKFPQQQPIYLTHKLENPNSASILINLKSEGFNQIENFEKYLDIFDGNNPDQVKEARNRWSQYKAMDPNIKYWKQQLNGSWEQNS